MKRLSYFVIAIVVAIGLFEWLSRGYLASWEPKLRAYLEKTASHAIHREVRIENISISPRNGVHLNNIRVSPIGHGEEPEFTANQIQLTLSFVGLPRAIFHREFYRAIGSVIVDKPHVRLSRTFLAEQQRKRKPSQSFITWFSLYWTGATVQIADPNAPHGQWTLYQGEGFYKIRGPRSSVAVAGSIEEARQVKIQWTQLGQRWNASVTAEGDRAHSVVDRIETFVKHPILPKDVVLAGTYAADVRASGRNLPRSGDDWLDFLDKSSLTVTPSAPTISTHTRSLVFDGTLVYKKRTLSSSKLIFQTPWVSGQGKVDIALRNRPQDRIVEIAATIPDGKLGGLGFQNGVVHVTHQRNLWLVSDTTLQFLGGRVSAKGTLSSAATDLALTAENIALAEMKNQAGSNYLSGSLNASCVIKGPMQNLQMNGAWWLSEGRWGEIALGNARGDFSSSANQFQAQGRSDSTKFRLSLAGTRSRDLIDMDHLEVHLPSGASASASGQYRLGQRKLQFTLNASQISLPLDLPFLRMSRTPIQGRLSGQGQLSGDRANPTFKMTVRSTDLSYQGQSIGESSAVIGFQNHQFELPTFHIGSGIEGKFVKGDGLVKIQNAQIGKWSLSQGGFRFHAAPKKFEITELSIQSRQAHLLGEARAQWETPEGSPDNTVAWSGKGRIEHRAPVRAWAIPFDFAGKFTLGPKTRLGQLHIDANLLEGMLRGDFKLEGTPENPQNRFTGTLTKAKWKAYTFMTHIDAAWSSDGLNPLRLNGQIANGGNFEFLGQLLPNGQAIGALKLTAFNLRPLSESLHFPKPVEGLAQAVLSVKGPLNQLQWTGRLSGGPWVYGPDRERPYRLENVDLDMALVRMDASTTTYRLTLNEGQAKTSEELIRFRPKSFIEFAGKNPAQLSMGADVRNLHLGIFTVFGGLQLDGTWQVRPEGFAIQTRAQTRSLFINDYELEEGAVIADYVNGVLKFSGVPGTPTLIKGSIDFHEAPQLTFTDLFITGKFEQGLRLSGEVGPSHWDYAMEGRGLDMSTLAELAGFPYPLSGVADVHVKGRGDSKRPHIEGKIELSNGSAMGLTYKTGNAAFVWQDDKISFTKLYLTDPGRYGIEGSGVFPIRRKEQAKEAGARAKRQPDDVAERPAPVPPIDFSLRLKDSNLSLLQSLSKEVISAKGSVEGILQMKGTLEDPRLKGSIRIINGEIEGAHYFKVLRGANLHLEFADDTVHIKDLRGKSGEGEFRGSGQIKLAGFVPAWYDTQLAVVSNKGLDVQVPELAIPDSPLAKRFKFLTTDSRGQVKGQVSLRGPAESPTFSGEALISNGHFTFPPSHKRQANRAILEWFRRIHWDVYLKFLEGAWFENELVQAKVLGALSLKGPSDQLVVDGGIDIHEGRVSYLGLQFEIQQARYDIRSEQSGDKIVNRPYVRGVAESRAQAVDTVSGGTGGPRLSINDTITLNIDYAPIDQIKPRLTSANNPTLSQEKLLARVTQTDMENLTVQERTALYQRQLVSIIDSSLTTPLAQNVLKKVGIADRLHASRVFDPSTVTGDDLNTVTGQQQQQSTSVNLLANTKYTIEKDLSNRLSVGYGVRFIPSAQADPVVQEKKLDLISDVQLSYRWFRNVYLRGAFDLPNANPSVLPDRRVTIEPRWRFGWWGNTNKEKKK